MDVLHTGLVARLTGGDVFEVGLLTAEPADVALESFVDEWPLSAWEAGEGDKGEEGGVLGFREYPGGDLVAVSLPAAETGAATLWSPFSVPVVALEQRPPVGL